jgi:hypothetical protein
VPPLEASNTPSESEFPVVLAQLVGWFDDYNTQAPHSALGIGAGGISAAHVRLPECAVK